MKRLLCMQDVSCIGKCSMMAQAPVLSCMEVETVPLPTSLLSSHTAFRHVSRRSLDDGMEDILEAWREEGIVFDGFLSGYLAGPEEVERAERIIESPLLKDGALVIVDPVFGDHGKLYRGFDPSFAGVMGELVKRADVIVPNLTEALCLLGEDPGAAADGREEDASFWRERAERLRALGPDYALISGFCRSPETIGAICAGPTGTRTVQSMRYPESFHGTGDLFAGVLAGGLLRGMAFEGAALLASDFVSECIRLTREDSDRRWYGTSFEKALPWLVDALRREDGRDDG